MPRRRTKWRGPHHLSLKIRTHTCAYAVVRCRSLTRTDRVNGDGDGGVKQRSEIWRQEETESQNKRGGSRGMEHRMKLTDIKTARTHQESFPFLRANIQRLVGGWESEKGRERLSLKSLKTAQKKRNFLKPTPALSVSLPTSCFQIYKF